MQYIIEYVTSVVIGSMLILMVANLSLRSQDSRIETAQVEAGKTQLRVLVDLIRHDINNMGAGMTYPNESHPSRVVRAFGPGSGTHSGYDLLSFYGLQDDGASGVDTVLVTYRWRPEGTATLPSGTTINTLQVERLEQVDGHSTTTHFQNVTTFSVQLLDKEFTHVPAGSADLERVRYVHMDVAMVSPLGTEGLLEQTQWGKQFRPLNLNPEGTHVVQAACYPDC